MVRVEFTNKGWGFAFVGHLFAYYESARYCNNFTDTLDWSHISLPLKNKH